MSRWSTFVAEVKTSLTATLGIALYLGIPLGALMFVVLLAAMEAFE